MPSDVERRQRCLGRPPPRILIGGGGERKTLRLVARYTEACNIFGGPAVGDLATIDPAHL